MIKCNGGDPPVIISKFKSMKLHHCVMNNIKKSEFKKPTQIQKTAIPCIMNGNDLVLQIDKNSVNTFLIPLFDKVLKKEWKSTGFGINELCFLITVFLQARNEQENCQNFYIVCIFMFKLPS